MKLNCRTGDLAIVVKSKAGNEGKIVKCLAVTLTAGIPTIEGPFIEFIDGPRYVWLTETVVNLKGGRSGKVLHSYFVSDANLKPLRGDISDDQESIEKEKALTL
jgi:hypothetical protein